MEELQKLYQGLKESGDVTIGFDEFQSYYSIPKNKEGLYSGLKQSGDVTIPFEEFDAYYFTEKKKPQPQVSSPASGMGSETVLEDIPSETLSVSGQVMPAAMRPGMGVLSPEAQAKNEQKIRQASLPKEMSDVATLQKDFMLAKQGDPDAIARQRERDAWKYERLSDEEKAKLAEQQDAEGAIRKAQFEAQPLTIQMLDYYGKEASAQRGWLDLRGSETQTEIAVKDLQKNLIGTPAGAEIETRLQKIYKGLDPKNNESVNNAALDAKKVFLDVLGSNAHGVWDDYARSEANFADGDPVGFHKRLEKQIVKTYGDAGYQPEEAYQKLATYALDRGIMDEERTQEAKLMQSLEASGAKLDRAIKSGAPEALTSAKIEYNLTAQKIEALRAQRFAKVDDEIRQIQAAMLSESISDKDKEELKKGLVKLNGLKQGFINPNAIIEAKYAVYEDQANAALPNGTPLQKLKKFFAELEYNRGQIATRIAKVEGDGTTGQFAAQELMNSIGGQGHNDDHKRLIQIEAQMKDLAPIVFLNESPELRDKNPTVWEDVKNVGAKLMMGASGVGILGGLAMGTFDNKTDAKSGFGSTAWAGMLNTIGGEGSPISSTTREQDARELMRNMQLAGVSPEELTDPNQTYLKERAKEPGLGDREFYGGLVGASSGLMIHLLAAAELTKGAGLSSAISSLTKAAKVGKNTKTILTILGDAIESGVNYELAGQFSVDNEDELTFAGGFFGGAAAGVTKVGFNKATSIVTKIFGNKAPDALKLIADFGARRAGSGLGEVSEESLQQIVQMWRSSDTGKDFWDKMDKQFLDLSEASKFFISTFLMGSIMGPANSDGVGDHLMREAERQRAELSPADRTQVNMVTEQLQAEQAALVEASLTASNNQSERKKELVDEARTIAKDLESGNLTPDEQLAKEERLKEIDNEVLSMEEVKVDYGKTGGSEPIASFPSAPGTEVAQQLTPEAQAAQDELKKREDINALTASLGQTGHTETVQTNEERIREELQALQDKEQGVNQPASQVNPAFEGFVDESQGLTDAEKKRKQHLETVVAGLDQIAAGEQYAPAPEVVEETTVEGAPEGLSQKKVVNIGGVDYSFDADELGLDMAQQALAEIAAAEEAFIEEPATTQGEEQITTSTQEQLKRRDQQIAEQINEFFTNLAGTIGENASEKIKQYADRIIAGESRDSIIDGLKDNWVTAIDEAVALQQQSPATDESIVDVTGEAPAPIAAEETVDDESTRFENMDDAEIERRMSELEVSRNPDDQKEFNALEKEMAQREMASVFDVALEDVDAALQVLEDKEKTMPNGFGPAIEMQDIQQTREVAEAYLDAEELSDADVLEDFKEALLGNPNTWYADRLKLRESSKEAARREISTQALFDAIVAEFVNDGFSQEDAAQIINQRMESISAVSKRKMTPPVSKKNGKGAAKGGKSKAKANPNRKTKSKPVADLTPSETITEATAATIEAQDSPTSENKAHVEEVEQRLIANVEDVISFVSQRNTEAYGKILKALKKFSIKELSKFFHASSSTRQGRLSPNTAPQFGTGIYFSTNKDLVKDEFGDAVTEVMLALENPVYTNTPEYYQVEELAIREANKESLRKNNLTEEQVQSDEYDGDWEPYYEIDENFPIDFLPKAAKAMGYDAIVDLDSMSYENEISVIDESKIIYEEDIPRYIADAYRKGENRELVAAVNEAIGANTQQTEAKDKKKEARKQKRQAEAPSVAGQGAIDSFVEVVISTGRRRQWKKSGNTWSFRDAKKGAPLEDVVFLGDWNPVNSQEMIDRVERMAAMDPLTLDAVNSAKEAVSALVDVFTMRAAKSGMLQSRFDLGLGDPMIRFSVAVFKGAKVIAIKLAEAGAFTYENWASGMKQMYGEEYVKTFLAQAWENAQDAVKAAAKGDAATGTTPEGDVPNKKDKSVKKERGERGVYATLESYADSNPDSVNDALTVVDKSYETMDIKDEFKKAKDEVTKAGGFANSDVYTELIKPVQQSNADARTTQAKRLMAIRFYGEMADQLSQQMDESTDDAQLAKLKKLRDTAVERMTALVDIAASDATYMGQASAIMSEWRFVMANTVGYARAKIDTYNAKMMQEPKRKKKAKAAAAGMNEVREQETADITDASSVDQAITNVANEEMPAPKNKGGKTKGDTKGLFMTKAESQAMAAKALADMKAAARNAAGQMGSGAIPAVFDFMDAAGRYGVAIMAQGVITFKEWSAKMMADTDATQEEVQDLWDNHEYNGSTLAEHSREQLARAAKAPAARTAEQKKSLRGKVRKAINDHFKKNAKPMSLEDRLMQEAGLTESEAAFVVESITDEIQARTMDEVNKRPSKEQLAKAAAPNQARTASQKKSLRGKVRKAINDHFKDDSGAMSLEDRLVDEAGLTPEEAGYVAEIAQEELEKRAMDKMDAAAQQSARPTKEDFAKAAATPQTRTTEKKQTLRGQIRKVIDDHFKKGATPMPLQDRLMQDAGLTEEEAAYVVESIKDELTKRTKAKIEAKAKALGKKKAQPKKPGKSDSEKAIEAMVDGELTDEMVQQIFADRLGLVAQLTPDQMRTARALGTALSESKPGSITEMRAAMALDRFMYSVLPIESRGELYWDLFKSLVYSNMLMGVPTHMKNLISSGAMTVFSFVETAANASKWKRAASLALKAEDGQKMMTLLRASPITELAVKFAALGRGWTQGARVAWDIMHEGYIDSKYISSKSANLGRMSALLERHRFTNPVARAFGGNMFKYVGRALAAEDAWMYAINHEMELADAVRRHYLSESPGGPLSLTKDVGRMLALSNPRYQEALEEAEQDVDRIAGALQLSEKEKKRLVNIRAKEILVDKAGLTEGEREQAEDIARSRVFTLKRNGVFGKMATVMNNINNSKSFGKVTWIWMPFANIVGNIGDTFNDYFPGYGVIRANGVSPTALAQSLGYTKSSAMMAVQPEGTLGERIKATLGTREDQRYYEQMGRAWLGSAMMLAAMVAYGIGDDDEENDWIRFTGDQDPTYKNFLIIGGEPIVSWALIPPIAPVAAIMSEANQFKKAHPTETRSWSGRVFYAMTSVEQSVGSLSVAESIQNLNEVVQTSLAVMTKGGPNGQNVSPEQRVKSLRDELGKSELGVLSRINPLTNPLVGQIVQVFDPKQYSHQTIEQSLEYAALGVFYRLDPFDKGRMAGVDVFGDEIKSMPAEDSFGFLSEFKDKQFNDKRWKFLADHGGLEIMSRISNPSELIKDEDGEVSSQKMTEKQFGTYARLAGGYFKKSLDDYMSGSDGSDWKKDYKTSKTTDSDEKITELQEKVKSMLSKSRTKAKNDMDDLSIKKGGFDGKRL